MTQPPLTDDEIEGYDEIIAGIRTGNEEAISLGRICLQLVMRNAPPSILLALLTAIRDEAVRQASVRRN